MDIKIKCFGKRYILKAFKPGWIIYNTLAAGIFTSMFYLFVIFMFLLG